MAARMIRDDMLDSERVQKRSVPARWLYLTILLSADDVGLFEVSHFKLHRAAALDEKSIPVLLKELAEADLSLRGAGDLYGTQQWGVSDIGMEALKNPRLIEAARTEARMIVAEDPALSKHAALAVRAARAASRLHAE